MELALGEVSMQGSWWRMLLDSNSHVAREYSNCWEIIQREGEQASTYLGRVATGALATGPAIVLTR